MYYMNYTDHNSVNVPFQCLQVYHQFVPLLPGRTETNNAVMKSMIELIRMKERYEAIGTINQDPQLALAQLLYGKVAEQICLWVSCIAISRL